MLGIVAVERDFGGLRANYVHKLPKKRVLVLVLAGKRCVGVRLTRAHTAKIEAR